MQNDATMPVSVGKLCKAMETLREKGDIKISVKKKKKKKARVGTTTTTATVVQGGRPLGRCSQQPHA